jgi:hypothetical protein
VDGVLEERLLGSRSIAHLPLEPGDGLVGVRGSEKKTIYNAAKPHTRTHTDNTKRRPTASGSSSRNRVFVSVEFCDERGSRSAKQEELTTVASSEWGTKSVRASEHSIARFRINVEKHLSRRRVFSSSL